MRLLGRQLVTGIIAILMMANAASAQQTGTLSGVVHDAQGGVLPGVTVTVTGDTLIGGSRRCSYRRRRQLPARALPPGTYNVVRAHRLRAAEARGHHRAGRPDRARRRRARRRQPAGDRHRQRRSPVVDVSTTVTQTNIDEGSLRGHSHRPQSVDDGRPRPRRRHRPTSTSAAPRARSSTTSRPSARPTARSRSASTASR